ncbi:conjugal transfer protein TraF [Halorhodospira halophila]|uniref:ThiS, thiamine-biosynthesis n=1 Tax=Halorhodospira halophila (strain DSM 244 / SL1) TaxID=349124 RepID=A1WY94_HALHL|nr:ThiS, thiamine-biosynthesis [Halorhodospira halophila SL1]MBK1728336.1 hypothetical protein [Halorhodospira halophila]
MSMQIERGARSRSSAASCADRPGRGTPRRLQQCSLGVVTALTMAVSSSVSAAPGLVTTPGMGLGDGSHPATLHTVAGNPAGAAAADRVGVQFGLGSVGVGYELGPVDGLVDEIDDIIDILDRDDLGPSEADDLIERTEGVLAQLGQDGWGKLQFGGRPPLAPLVVGSARSGWSVALDAEATGHLGFSILDDELRFVRETEQIQSNTAAYLKGGGILRLSAAPSLRVAEWEGGRELFVGARVSHYQAELSKAVVALAEDTNRDFGDIVEDEIDRQQETSSAVGLDLGVMYQTRFFRAGGAWKNINEPTFDFPAVGTDCSGEADPDLQANCLTAANFSDRITREEAFRLNEQVTLEGALHDPAQRLVLAASYDANTVRDISGDEYQWLAFSLSYRMPWYLKWVPDLRVGYRENMSGSELSYTTAGLTWLGAVTLDVAVADQDLEHDGESIPRSAMAHLGFQLRF